MHVIFSFFILVPYVHLNVFYEYGPWVGHGMGMGHAHAAWPMVWGGGGEQQPASRSYRLGTNFGHFQAFVNVLRFTLHFPATCPCIQLLHYYSQHSVALNIFASRCYVHLPMELPFSCLLLKSLQSVNFDFFFLCVERMIKSHTRD